MDIFLNLAPFSRLSISGVIDNDDVHE